MRMQIDNYTAWVTVDGEEQPSHFIEYSPDGTVATCWITSEAGKKFSVHWQDSLCAYPSSGSVSVDGVRGSGKVLSGDKLRRGDGILYKDGIKTSATTKRPFMFSELELTDDDQYLHNPVSPELGKIKLVIRQCQVVGRVPRINRQASEPEKIHERFKKAMGHRCKFGIETACRGSTDMIRIKRLGKLATFVFEYRPLAQLQANGIVPLEERRRVETSNEVIDLTLDEPSPPERKSEMRGRLKEEPGTSRVKQETRRRQMRQPAEVVDLT